MTGESGFRSMITAFIAGFFAGALVTVLLTPKSGHEARRMIKESGKQAYEAGGRVVEPAKKVMEPVMKFTGGEKEAGENEEVAA